MKTYCGMTLKQIYLLALIIGLALFGIRDAQAWSCETHQYICENYYNYTGDCCKADREHTPAPYYHHCTNNAPNCEARLKASEYVNDEDIYFHLQADASCEAHWYSFNDSTHSKFETCVNNHIKNGDTTWKCDITGTDKSGVERWLYTDDYDFARIFNYHAPIVMNPPKSLIETIIEFIRNLFK